MGFSCTPKTVATITRKIIDSMTTTTCEGHHQRVTHSNTHDQTDNHSLPCQSYHFINDLVLEQQHRQLRLPPFKTNNYPDETQHRYQTVTTSNHETLITLLPTRSYKRFMEFQKLLLLSKILYILGH